MNISTESIFNKQRFATGPSLFFLILYAPLGIVLLTLRAFISLQLCLASLILPSGTILRKFVLRILFTVMGVVVRENDLQKQTNGSQVIITNHITPFDHLVISLVYPCVSISVHKLPSAISKILCYKDFGVTRGKEVLKKNIQAHLEKPNNPPLLIHPEGATTNGRVALMKYGSWAFEFDKSILVLGLKAYRLPLLHIEPSVLGSSWAADLFFALFSPVTIYTIKYIGKMTKEENETFDEFASRAQKATAAAIGLKVTNHNVSDKIEYIKRLAREEAAAENPLFNPEVHMMSVRVKEVLPYLPLDLIKKDIVRTRSVDMTITNFLEGNIPEAVQAQQSVAASITNSSLVVSSTPSTSSPTRESASKASSTESLPPTRGTTSTTVPPPNLENMSMSAKCFGKDASERMLSLDERKSQLIEKVRRRYLEKHSNFDKKC